MILFFITKLTNDIILYNIDVVQYNKNVVILKRVQEVDIYL